jgi:hypothetical protein
MANLKNIIAIYVLMFCSVSGIVLASENVWVSFNSNPNFQTFEACSNQIGESISGGLKERQNVTYVSLFKPDTFTPYLEHVEKGNAYALELGFQLIQIAIQNASVSEELLRSLGNSIKKNPNAFLIFLDKYCQDKPQVKNHILLGIESGMNEEWDLAIAEIDIRISALEKVKNPKPKIANCSIIPPPLTKTPT